MAFSFKFYSDAGLSAEITTLQATQLADGSSPPSGNDQLFYIGSTESGMKARASSNPGTDPIEVTPAYAVDAWSASAAISADDVVMPSSNNGYKYQAQGSGTTHASTEPTWPTTIGQTVADNDITWECIDELHQPAEIVLAATAGALDTNTPGAALDLGTEILSETGNATPVHVRVDQDAHPVGTWTDLKLQLTQLNEEAV